ncbi:unnamed protein product [Rhodiola kirilowii]
MMQHVIRRQPVQVKPCGFCAATDHKTDECLTIVEDDQAEINAVGANGQPWRNDNHQHHVQREPAQHAAPQQTQQPYRPPHRQYQQNAPNQYQQRGPNNNQAGPSNHGPTKVLEDIVKELAASTQQLATTVH